MKRMIQHHFKVQHREINARGVEGGREREKKSNSEKKKMIDNLSAC
jgi:hypothetical protein